MKRALAPNKRFQRTASLLLALYSEINTPVWPGEQIRKQCSIKEVRKKGELHIEAARSVDEVFDFLTDLRNERLWNPRIVRIEKVIDGPISTGTQFQGLYAGIGELTTEILLFERPRQFSFRSLGPRMRIEGEFVLEPSRDGTRIDLEAELLPQSWFRLLAPLMTPVIQKQNVAAGERLKGVLYTQAPARAE